MPLYKHLTTKDIKVQMLCCEKDTTKRNNTKTQRFRCVCYYTAMFHVKH